jgi:hypothetical protein
MGNIVLGFYGYPQDGLPQFVADFKDHGMGITLCLS